MNKQTKSNILVIWPPKLEFIFSIQKHYTYFGETIGYLKDHTDLKITVMDGSSLMFFQWDFIKEYTKCYDFLLVYTDLHNSISALKAAQLCKSISPNTTAISYGQGTAYIPFELLENGFDAAITDYQFEESIVGFINYKIGKSNIDNLKGIVYKDKDNIVEIKDTFEHNMEKISFPALDLIPVEQYKKISGRDQLCFTVSRGCSFSCKFCRVPIANSNKTSYRDIKSTIEFVKKYMSEFSSIKFIAPTFTENREWVIKLCNEIINERIKFQWIVTTRIELLDKELVILMSKAGCIAVAFGLETLYQSTQAIINKEYSQDFLIKQFKLLHDNKIIPKAFIMLGIQCQTKTEIDDLYSFLQSHKIEIRPKEYYPYEKFFESSNKYELMKHFDRDDVYCNNLIKDIKKIDFINYLLNRTNVR
ncbi:MAG: radical SAM protein [Candidatus Kapaibacterium sp.]